MSSQPSLITTEVEIFVHLQTLVLPAKETVIVTMTVKAISNVGKEIMEIQDHLTVVVLSSVETTTVTTQIVNNIA